MYCESIRSHCGKYKDYGALESSSILIWLMGIYISEELGIVPEDGCNTLL
jgi:hypothetical protein